MHIVVKCTSSCNLRCVYCSEGDKPVENLDCDDFFKLIDELPDLLIRIADKNVTILWHGGEPLMWGISNLSRCMDYALEKLSGCNVRFIMQSNGYSLQPQYLDLIKKYQIKVGVSIDGIKEIHNKNRPTIDGKPTFDVIKSNIAKLKELNLCGGILIVAATHEQLNCDLLYDFIYESGVSCKINPLIACGRAKSSAVENINEAYVDLMKGLFKKSMQSDKTIIIEPLDKIIDAIITNDKVNECSYSGSCSQAIICLFVDGSVSFCGRDNNNQDHVYGSIKNQSLTELYYSSKAESIRSRDKELLKNDCKNCDVWNLCHGGCAYEAFLSNGTIFSKFSGCEYRKELLHFMKTEGLLLFKNRLIAKKREIRKAIADKKNILKELLSNYEK